MNKLSGSVRLEKPARQTATPRLRNQTPQDLTEPVVAKPAWDQRDSRRMVAVFGMMVVGEAAGAWMPDAEGG